MRLLAAMVLLFASTTRGQTQVDVKVLPSTVEYRTFDPANRPPDMPRLRRSVLAYTQFSYSCDASGVGEPIGKLRERTIEAHLSRIQLTLSLRNVIWLPQNASQHLRDHEEGHRQINERIYQQAEAVAREVAEDWTSRTLTGTGDTARAAVSDALGRATQSIANDWANSMRERTQRVNDLYDRITRFSRNTKVGVDAAIERAFSAAQEPNSQTR